MIIYLLSSSHNSNIPPSFFPISPQSTVVACLRYLQTSMEAVVGQENTEMETEGYLLEKSVSETIMEYLDPVMKLLLINQVEDGQVKAEAGAAGTSGATTGS